MKGLFSIQFSIIFYDQIYTLNANLDSYQAIYACLSYYQKAVV